MSNPQTDTRDRELRLSRTLNAPIELVWKVWTNPEHICQWWGPDGFTCTISKMEVAPEGKWNLVLHGPDGTDYKNESVFKEVVPFKKLVYEHASYPHFVATIQFTAIGDQTGLDWHMLFDSREDLVKVVKTFKADVGLKQNIEKMAAYLQNHKTV
ncbi:polyketide cyclase [Mucilaginibacter sp. PPCGB 2223]|uniref:SRPBCC family protein n=1 Tax=Mucilaginibacter sp. PPCGB 2223 TaxID=1886027 RepID=UPI000824284A|nr:SRPBCC family protein [Mucilaginibacter sp. PPCGB 2223]OCX52536.1 polyketide cyclase [Mucilaginibacter sp. PPCGB 2223]